MSTPDQPADVIERARQIAEDLATVRSAHDFDSGTAPYQPEVLHVARAAERLADEVDRLTALLASRAPQGDTAEDIAQAFHEAYERLAPSYGYETRKASAKPWADVPEPNRSLMIAVAAEVASLARGQTGDDDAAVERAARAMWRGGIWNPDTHLLDDWRAAAHVALTALRRGGDHE